MASTLPDTVSLSRRAIALATDSVLTIYGKAFGATALARTPNSRNSAARCRVIDPDVPSFVAYELVDGHYVEVATAHADEAAQVAAPFPVRVVPSELV